MSTSVNANNLFMNQVKPPSDDSGILNLGKHCFKCNSLDFLPFHCEFCNHTYCSRHRTLETHNCVGRTEKRHVPTEYDGPSAASLFPDHAERQKKLNASLKPPKPTSIAAATAKSNPLMKLTKFLHLQRMERQKSGKPSLFGRQKPSKPSKVAETAAIKKVAKGSPAVPQQDRVHLWVLYLNRNENELDQINVERERKGVWVSKSWSVGRALDSVSDVLGIMNHNNSTSDATERLNLFKVRDDVPVLLETSKKVSGELTSGDTLYLVKGSMS